MVECKHEGIKITTKTVTVRNETYKVKWVSCIFCRTQLYKETS